MNFLDLLKVGITVGAVIRNTPLGGIDGRVLLAGNELQDEDIGKVPGIAFTPAKSKLGTALKNNVKNNEQTPPEQEGMDDNAIKNISNYLKEALQPSKQEESEQTSKQEESEKQSEQPSKQEESESQPKEESEQPSKQEESESQPKEESEKQSEQPSKQEESEQEGMDDNTLKNISDYLKKALEESEQPSKQ